MDGWSVIKDFGVYLGLGIDDRMASKMASDPGQERYLRLIQASAYGTFARKYRPEAVKSILQALYETDLSALGGDGREERREKLSISVYERSAASAGGPFGEFDMVFQEFVGRFKSALEGVMSVMGLTKESISLENTGIKEYLAELKELPCRRLGELDFGEIYRLQSKASSSKHIISLLKKYDGKGLSTETSTGVIEVINRVSGYPNYFKLMDSQRKLVEARPILLAVAELQKHSGSGADKQDLLSAMSMLLFNVFPTPKLLKFVAKFEPSPENDLLRYDHYSLLALNYTLFGRLKDAAVYNERAYDCATDEEKRAYTHMLGSCICISRREFGEAINMLHRCIALTRDRRMKAMSQFYMGILYYELDNIDEADKCLKLARVGIEDEADMMSLCNDIGTCAMARGDLKAAIKSFEYVDRLGQYMGSNTAKFLKSIAYGDLGIIHMSMLDYERATEYFKKALVLSRDTHNQKGVANQIGNIGLALKRQLDYGRSLEYFKSALNFSYSIDYPEGVSFAFSQVEQLMALQGMYDEVEAYKKEVIKRNPGISRMLKK